MQKALDQVSLAGELAVQDLDGNRLIEVGVLRQVDRTHPTLAQALLDLIAFSQHAPDERILFAMGSSRVLVVAHHDT